MGDESLGRFQVWLRGTWMDYDAEEDRLCKRAYFTGRPMACYSFRGCKYEVDFHALEQRNLKTGKARRIRPPGRRTTPVSAAAVTALPTAMAASSVTKNQVARVVVPPGAPGATIRFPHPSGNGEFLVIAVPPQAREGQVMLVPVAPVAGSSMPWLADTAHRPFVDQALAPEEDEEELTPRADVFASAPAGAIKIKVTEPVARVPSIYRAARGATLPANFGHGLRGSPIPDVDVADDAYGLDAALEAQDIPSPRHSAMMTAAGDTPEVTLAIPPVVVAAVGAEYSMGYSQSLTPEALAPFLNGHALPLPPEGTMAHTRQSSATSSGRTARLLSMLPSVTLASECSDDADSCAPMDTTRTSSSCPPLDVAHSCPPAMEIARTAANTLASDQVASLLQGVLEADAVRGDDRSFMEAPLSGRTEAAHTSPAAKVGRSKSAPAELEAAMLASITAFTEESSGDSVADDASNAEQEEVHSEHPPARPVKEPAAKGPISISGKAGAAAVLALGGIGATGGEACAETGHDLGQAIAVEAGEFVEWADDVADNIGDYIMGLF